MTVATETPVRCSRWARDVGLSPVGTAGSWAGFLLAEQPLPWPHDVGEIPTLEALAPLLRPQRIRLQAVLPPSEDAQSRVVLHRSTTPEGWFSGYQRYSAAADPGALPEVVARLLDDSSTGAGSTETDLLVCTHGRRDVCCGSSGTSLARALAAGALHHAGGGMLWRTSHTGGHRFAPTFILLPQGTAWAFADEDVVRAVVNRSQPFADLAGHYRGCAGLGSPQVQILEREVLRHEGWEILDRRRRGSVSDGGVALLEVDDGHGGIDRWQAQVAPGRTLPVPDCGKLLTEARKSETEWTIAGFRQT